MQTTINYYKSKLNLYNLMDQSRQPGQKIQDIKKSHNRVKFDQCQNISVSKKPFFKKQSQRNDDKSTLIRRYVQNYTKVHSQETNKNQFQSTSKRETQKNTQSYLSRMIQARKIKKEELLNQTLNQNFNRNKFSMFFPQYVRRKALNPQNSLKIQSKYISTKSIQPKQHIKHSTYNSEIFRSYNKFQQKVISQSQSYKYPKNLLQQYCEPVCITISIPKNKNKNLKNIQKIFSQNKNSIQKKDLMSIQIQKLSKQNYLKLKISPFEEFDKLQKLGGWIHTNNQQNESCIDF